MKRRIVTLLRSLLMLASAMCAAPAFSDANHSAADPSSDRQIRPASLRQALGALPIRRLQLTAPDPEELQAAKRANAGFDNKVLQIGIGRDVPDVFAAESTSLRWRRVRGGLAAHWEITSPGAHALRIGLVAESLSPGVQIRFTDGENGAVYGPFSADDVILDSVYWSPVLGGEGGVIEIFVPEGATLPIIAVTQISHLFADPSAADAESQAKDGSQFCELDLVCRAATDAAMAFAGRAVARMTFTSGGSTFLCSGTLLNPLGGSFIPYFYSANHCISSQTVASTLTTHWFYDRTGCGFGGTSPNYVQLTGGATLIYHDTASDGLLLRLNSAPPADAVFAGWDSATLDSATPITAIHHPAGDWKKVSLGSVGGFGSPGGPSMSYVKVNWSSGVTEGGSSGSGIFTAVGQPATDYQLRGGLFGGPSSCPSPTYDYYSRFDQIYPAIQQYLNPTPACSYLMFPSDLSGLPHGGGAATVTVTTPIGCPVAVTSFQAWVLVNSVTPAGRATTVSLQIAANPGGPRATSILLADRLFLVSQQ